jgi:pimeloyl-ACP methyl ester carboxylesterase
MTSDSRPLEFRTGDGLTLRGVRWGEEESPVMVFSPGNGFTAQCYRPAFSQLLPRACIHGLNPRGFGGSDIPREFEGWDAPFADLQGYIEQTLEPPIVAAGHSFGSMLSLRLAAEAPGLVRGLLLIDPGFSYRRSEPWPAEPSDRLLERVARTRTRRAEWPHRASAERWLRARGDFTEWHDAALQAFLDSGLVERERGGVRLACPTWLETRIYETGPGRLMWEWAQRVRAPTVILRGEDSPVASAEALEELADLLPVATVLTVKGGHTFPQEHPEPTAEALALAWQILERTVPDSETAL